MSRTLRTGAARGATCTLIMSSLRFSAVGLFLLLTGCGGIVDSPLLDGGPDGAPADGGADAVSTPDSGQTCDSLLNQLATEATSAVQCCATCNIAQCTVQVEGLCCPLTVDSQSSAAVMAYEATLAEIKASHCIVSCPGIACSTKPSDVCSQGDSCMQ